ncbi:MAG: acyl carrier protein [Acidobacteriia bacterium]|nr:acyl carrier protein [Terriglobia bacterium]
MTTQEISKEVLRILGNIAPEADLSGVRPDVPFRDQFDLDSMDMLNFVIALHKQFQIEIPEADYPRLSSLEGCAEYLESRQSAREPAR